MLFYEPLFLFYALPLLFFAYVLLHRNSRLRRDLLLFFSLGFYLWIEPRIVPIVLVSMMIDYALAARIAGSDSPRANRLMLALGILQNLAVLFFYKYFVFALNSLNTLLGFADVTPFAVPLIVLPVGISFITFEKISYLADVFRRVARPARSLVDYALYVFFFPKLLAGPIIKYHEIDEQIANLHQLRRETIVAGFERFALGVVKKVLLANPIATEADRLFALAPDTVGFGNAWFAVLCFTLQIYLDFSAYSDMAIGLARMLGFDLKENFRLPYLSCSITEFWRRWHISLSTYIRNYLYVPLGGSRVSPPRIYFNLWVCFLCSGIWHGANWTFVVWGAYNGLFLMLDRMFLLRLLERIPALPANAFNLLVVMVGWTIFRASSIGQAGDFLRAMTDPWHRSAPLYLSHHVVAVVVIAGVLSIGPRFVPYETLRAWSAGHYAEACLRAALLVLFVVACARAVAAPFQPFLYFRF